MFGRGCHFGLMRLPSRKQVRWFHIGDNFQNRRNRNMKRSNLVPVAAGLLAASLSWPGCSQSGKEVADNALGAGTITPQSGQNIEAETNVINRDAQEETTSRFNDAKAYCLGLLLYSGKHGHMFPSNLDQTLPYLSAANCLPSGTNHFDLLYRGSANSLPNPITNGIIVIRGGASQMGNGRWIRVYGFADGHCEMHSEIDGNFFNWEKEHSLPP